MVLSGVLQGACGVGRCAVGCVWCWQVCCRLRVVLSGVV